jgi:hypothetical protein
MRRGRRFRARSIVFSAVLSVGLLACGDDSSPAIDSFVPVNDAGIADAGTDGPAIDGDGAVPAEDASLDTLPPPDADIDAVPAADTTVDAAPPADAADDIAPSVDAGADDAVVNDTATVPDVVHATCSDGVDNDSDGWTDADDPDCTLGQIEQGFTIYTCNDDIDNDGDGLIDSDDPQCTSASDSSEHS